MIYGATEVFSSFKLERIYFLNDSYDQTKVIEIPTIHKSSLRIRVEHFLAGKQETGK